MNTDKKEQLEWAEHNVESRKQLIKQRKEFDKYVSDEYDKLLLRTRRLLAMYEVNE